ncbi:hypothetical protein C5Y97_26815 [Blastopirellula marina]|uniref:Uncharacterized protein n=2 Tax=Blastopirellula marina TaxID=124 RepID=A0A2S8F6C8_9BACT|nr:hypothetical protein C5Y98_26800 [Blastopirellula marina]PTL41450.1 hypothetical protein C5Y97_26815 [Blastopirellula marina]
MPDQHIFHETNPFASPELAEVDQQAFPNVPSGRVLWSCLVIGCVLNLLTSISYYSNSDVYFICKVLWSVPNFLYGVMYGLGLAMLTHAVIQRRFSTLSPGHWRLIVFLSLLGDELAWFVSLVLSTVLYLVFPVVTKESRAWRRHAWVMAAAYSLDLVRRGLVRVLEEVHTTGVRSLLGEYELLYGVMITINWGLLVLNLVAVILVLLGIRFDRQANIPRDSYHYAGLMLIVLVPWLHMAVYQIIITLAAYE